MKLEKPKEQDYCWQAIICVPEDVAGSEADMVFDEALEKLNTPDSLLTPISRSSEPI